MKKPPRENVARDLVAFSLSTFFLRNLLHALNVNIFAFEHVTHQKMSLKFFRVLVRGIFQLLAFDYTAAEFHAGLFMEIVDEILKKTLHTSRC